VMPNSSRWLSFSSTQSDRLPRWFDPAGTHRGLLQRPQAGWSCGCPTPAVAAGLGAPLATKRAVSVAIARQVAEEVQRGALGGEDRRTAPAPRPLLARGPGRRRRPTHATARPGRPGGTASMAHSRRPGRPGARGDDAGRGRPGPRASKRGREVAEAGPGPSARAVGRPPQRQRQTMGGLGGSCTRQA
jgi:hypothetical protein